MFGWAPFFSTKAAIKLHTLLDLRGSIPAFIHISDGKLHDVNVLDLLSFEAGAFYVTRAKSPMDARRVYSAPVERDAGVICDQRVMLNGYYSCLLYPTDAAAERSRVDLGGRRIIQKKKTKNTSTRRTIAIQTNYNEEHAMQRECRPQTP